MNSSFITTESLIQTQVFAKDFAKNLKGGDTLCLYGNLGAGKTTFVQGLASGLGIKQRIISPTFIIIREYKIKNLDFYHIDLYRIESKHDLIGLGIKEIISNTNNIIAIEWAEKLQDLMPKRRIDLRLEYIDENKRKITINKLL